jgi:ABC-type multidrug transport system ATPase subunit
MIGLHVDSVRKEFGEKRILNDVFISCKEGEIIGLLGRNGSGKSSLLKIIFGSVTADYKFVSVDDKKTKGLFSTRNVIHYLPQDSCLPGHVKIKTLISCFCNTVDANRMMGSDFIRPLLSKKVKQLSTGERRIVEIYMLLYSTAKFLLLDEPFNGIAPLHVQVIKDLIREIGKDKGIIITGQDYRNVIDLSARIILMRAGNTRAIKEISELVEFGYLNTL